MITGQTIAIKQNASNSDLQRAIEAAIPKATQQASSFASRYKGRTEQESCKKIFDYLSNNINYKADGPNQAVRLPSGLMRTAQGDCKSYSIFTSAVLSNLGITHSLCYVSYDPKDSTPSHIYVITDKGCIIDAVYGKFNAEKEPTYRKLKKMNISLISGINKRRASIGRSCGMRGIGASEGGLEWAKRNRVNLTGAQKTKFITQKFFPLAAGGREIFRKLIEKNAGGLANSLARTYAVAKANNDTPEFRKYRQIEIDWLEQGGNPNELLESIIEGNKKTPTGRYFNKLMKMAADGLRPNPAQYIAAGVSVLFGKKYNESTGAITGMGTGIGTGEPVTTTGTVATAPWWAPHVTKVVIILGKTAILASAGLAVSETFSEDGSSNGGSRPPGTPPPGGDETGDGSENEQSALNTYLPLIVIGGAAAAYFILKKPNGK